jgi:peptide chain release factor 3
MTNFGVELFLKTFLEYARCPAGREAFIESTTTTTSTVASQQQQKQQNKKEESTMILPDSDEFTGFVFKLQANLDPRHRDRMAFIRVCSGVFRKGMKVGHSRMKKSINLSSAQSLFAQERESVIEAYPGDVIGIHNPGLFAIGDTIFTGSNRIGIMILYYTIL